MNTGAEKTKMNREQLSYIQLKIPGGFLTQSVDLLKSKNSIIAEKIQTPLFS